MRRRAVGVATLVTALAAGAIAGSGAGAMSIAVVPVAQQTLIGRSAQGRPIAVTRIAYGGERVRRRVLVVGCVHGDECAGRAIVARLRARTLAGQLPQHAELLLVRNLNPDGTALGRRQNARGVDLNRNGSFGRRFLGPLGSRFYAGPRAWSEPESRAIRALILGVRPDVVVWYHQPLTRIDVPEAGWDGRARRYGQQVGLPVRPLPHYPGSLSRWVNERVRPGSSFVVELDGRRTLGDTLADRHADAVLALADPH
jgi:murein peptide amidase A